MSQAKKGRRAAFRKAVFTRDGFRCRVCGKKDAKLDPHHITDRSLVPGGGYVPKNGITLCPECHGMAELYHVLGHAPEGWHPDDLYRLIGSSRAQTFVPVNPPPAPCPRNWDTAPSHRRMAR
jgi:hypothetical protein